FRQLDLEEFNFSIRQEIESLVELANPDVCLKRCERFNLSATRPEDYTERIIKLDESSFILAGIRFQGLDVSRPFVSVIGNFKDLKNIPFSLISELVKEEFKVFSPDSFHMNFPEGLSIPSKNFMIDRYTVMGNIQEIVSLELAAIPEKIELIGIKNMNFYDEYVNEYESLYEKSPFLKTEVKIESLESLNDAGKEDLLFEIIIDGKRAGVIAGYLEDYFGKKELCILEEILFERFKGKGFGVYLQKIFAGKMINRYELIWGHISDLNPWSLKTALKNGRKITEIEYSFSLNEIIATKAMPSEYEQIFMMGYDVWADGVSKTDYLKLCIDSPKYNKGQWYVLKDGDLLLSSLIVYQFSENTFGIGSIATPNYLRKKGFAANLISKVIEKLENGVNPNAIFLYSDIDPNFYEKFGFTKLPQSYQRYKTTICMVRSLDLNSEFQVPEYF
ncbi:MAG: GNAT family N-acetyltransferase, partial [Bdellovibrionales bacterium]|nr:GNAT family N-acetyltransferase [Bdellovibrionales bacterium]